MYLYGDVNEYVPLPVVAALLSVSAQLPDAFGAVTLATVVSDDVVGVYNVGTLPGHQRHGYGEAVMRHALENARAAHGIEKSILQSTPAGYRLYERMGYQRIASHTVFMETRFLH